MGARGPIRVGTSGFSYREWLGGFYPSGLPAAKMLDHYAARLATVEVNYTFRAMPRREMLEGWARRTPDDFRFALKAPQRITHFARLRNVEESVGHFVEVASALGERLGPVLFQLPPDFKRDVALLKDFLAGAASRLRAAFEFRNRSWFDDSTLETLHAANAALCIAESDKIAAPLERTASWLYLRLRREDYDLAALRKWSREIERLRAGEAEVFVYFKHEQSAPDLAMKLIGVLNGSG